MRVCRVEHNLRRLPMQVRLCENGIERGRGMLFRRHTDAGTAWLLRPCRAVHTFGMRHPIDILFCDAEGRILEVVASCPPWRIARHATAHHTWELASGGAAHWGWRVGDRILPC